MPAAVVRPPLEDVESIRMFLHEERIAPGAHLLDVPCGIGRRALGLAEAGFDVTAVDPNEMAIHAAKERIPDSIADRLHFVSVPRDALPGLVAGTRFDAILCLDHALGRGPRSDDVAFLGRLATHVGPDGRLAGTTRVPFVRTGDGRVAIGMEILRTRRPGLEAPHRVVCGAPPPHAAGPRCDSPPIGLADGRRLGRMAAAGRNGRPPQADRPRNTRGLKRERAFLESAWC